MCRKQGLSQLVKSKMDTTTKILICLGLVVVVLLFAVVYEMRQEGTDCISSPLVYGVRQYTDDNQEMVCACSFNNPNTPIIYVNKDKIDTMKR